MFSKFSECAKKVLLQAKKEMVDLCHPYVGSEHLLLAILKDKNSNTTKKLKKYNIEYQNFKKEIINVIGIGKEKTEWFLYTPLLKKIIQEAMDESKESNVEVTSDCLFNSLIQQGEGIAIRVMLSMGIDFDKIVEEFNVQNITKKNKNKKKLIIEEYGLDLTKKANQEELDPVIGREQELNRIIEILCRKTKNNPLLIGEAGVGKTAIIEELTKMIANGIVPNQLKNKRVISLQMSSLVAGTKYRGEFEERINKIMKELENNNDVIVFIDEIHTLVGAGGAEGAIDASNILKPTLARGRIKVIGATTIEEYKKYIEKDRALSRRFQTIKIEEPDIFKTKEILLKLRPIYENFHNVIISDEIIDAIIKYSDKYIYDRKQPDKAIDILDEVSAKTSIIKGDKEAKIEQLYTELTTIVEDKNKSIIMQDFNQASLLRKKEHDVESKINKCEEKLKNKCESLEVTIDMVAETIRNKTGIPIFELEKEKTKKLNKIKQTLLKEVKGQEEAVLHAYKIITRVKLGMKKNNKPISILYAGPTGVGKTLLAKKISENLVGKDNLITLDMSEYKEEHTISKIIGAPPGYVGYENKSGVVEEIKDKPYSVILLDEIEKAHPSVVNLFLQILDEGKIKDSSGNIIRFDNTVIIMTSNIGFNKQLIGFNNNQKDFVISKIKDILSLEIINRIDNIIVFNRLNEQNIKTIISDKIKIIKDIFKQERINVTIHNRVIEEIIKYSDFKEFGARKIDKLINTRLNDLIIDELLSGKEKITIETLH